MTQGDRKQKQLKRKSLTCRLNNSFSKFRLQEEPEATRRKNSETPSLQSDFGALQKYPSRPHTGSVDHFRGQKPKSTKTREIRPSCPRREQRGNDYFCRVSCNFSQEGVAKNCPPKSSNTATVFKIPRSQSQWQHGLDIPPSKLNCNSNSAVVPPNANFYCALRPLKRSRKGQRSKNRCQCTLVRTPIPEHPHRKKQPFCRLADLATLTCPPASLVDMLKDTLI